MIKIRTDLKKFPYEPPLIPRNVFTYPYINNKKLRANNIEGIKKPIHSLNAINTITKVRIKANMQINTGCL